MMRQRLVIPAMIIAAILLPWLGGHPAIAAEEPEDTVIQLDVVPVMDNRGDDVPGHYWIMALLTTAEGRYVANRPIQIVEPVDFFGRRDARLGTAVTDGTGLAAVIYQPSQPGEQTIVARFGGDAQFAPSTDTLVVDATDVVAPFPEEPLPLASVGRGLAVFLGVLGLAFWAVLLGVLGRTVWRIKTAPGAAADLQPAAGSRSQEVPI